MKSARGKTRLEHAQQAGVQVVEVYSGFGQGYVQDAFQKVSRLLSMHWVR